MNLFLKSQLGAIALLLSLTLNSCGGKEKGVKLDSKRRELDSLRKVQTQLGERIAKLEKELPADTSASAAGKSAIVTLNAPTTKTFKHYLEVQGRVDADQNILVAPQVPGAAVTSVRVTRGQKVSKGQVLATLDNSVAATSVNTLRGNVNLARIVYQKQKNLWDQKIGTEIAFLQAKNNYDNLQNQLATLNQQVALYTLKAPFSGTVEDVAIKVGETPGFGSGIRVVNTAGMKVLAEIAESYTGKIKVGDEVTLEFVDLGVTTTSKVRVIGQTISNSSRTFTIEVPIDASKVKVSPNMVAIVKVNDYSKANSITVPVNVVQQDDQGKYVYIAQNDGPKSLIATRRRVETGLSYGGEIEIKSGLTGADQVVTAGYLSLEDGQPLKIEQVAPPTVDNDGENPKQE